MVIRSTQSCLPAGSSSGVTVPFTSTSNSVNCSYPQDRVDLPVEVPRTLPQPRSAEGAFRPRTMTSTSSSESASAITISRSTPAASNSSTIAGVQLQVVGRGDLEHFEITALVGGEGADGLDDLADPGRVEIHSDPEPYWAAHLSARGHARRRAGGPALRLGAR